MSRIKGVDTGKGMEPRRSLAAMAAAGKIWVVYIANEKLYLSCNQPILSVVLLWRESNNVSQSI